MIIIPKGLKGIFMLYSEEQLKKMQATGLEILIAFDLFCRNNQLTYSLMYGTLLGAVRHKGFIPWDDDVDVAMPRIDYERFLSLSACFPKPYSVINTALNKKFPFFHTQIMKDETIAMMASTKYLNIPHGIFIDVYPLDFCEKDDKKTRRILKRRNKWLSVKTRHILPYNSPFFGGGINTGVKAIISKIIPLNLIMKISDMGYKNTKNKDFLIEYDDFNGGDGRLFPKNFFISEIQLPFENHPFYVTAKYDEVLKALYGDYMKLPPKNEQVGHHYYIELKF